MKNTVKDKNQRRKKEKPKQDVQGRLIMLFQ